MDGGGGLTLEEAGWIQPTYGFCSALSFQQAPKTAKCGDTIRLVVNELECGNTYSWRFTRNEEQNDESLEEDGLRLEYTIPETTEDGERFTFKVLTESSQGGKADLDHTVVVSCEGQDAAEPKKEDDDDDDASCSSTGSRNGAGLIFGMLFLVATFRRR